MKLAIIGIGQAGGRIADLFEYYDVKYRNIHGKNLSVCMAINTSQSDLMELKAIPSKDRILIGQSYAKSHGAGVNIDMGIEIAKQELSDIKKALGEREAFNTQNIDAFFLIAGLGGGTGAGGAPVLASELKTYNIPVIALGILPSNDEGGLMAVNASRSLTSLYETTDALILFDNNRWKTPGMMSIHDSYSHMNHLIVKIFPLVLGAGEVKTPTMVGGKVVDASDIINSLKGFTVYGYSEAWAKEWWMFKKKGKFDQLNPKDKCRAVLQDAVTRLSTDCALPSARKALLMLTGPPNKLSRNGFNEAVRWYEDNLKGAEIRCGDYPLPKSDMITGIVFISELYDIPRMRELMDMAVRHQKAVEEKSKIQPLLPYKLRAIELKPYIPEEEAPIPCPKCGSKKLQMVKSWDVVPKTGKGPAIRVTLYSCENGHKFRRATKIKG